MDLSPFDYIEEIVDDLKHKNRFFVDKEFNKLLDKLFDTYSEVIKKNKILYRARIYNEDDRFDKYHINNPINIDFFGFDEVNSFVNKNKSDVLDGRVNPSGISYLYVSSDIKTCIREVKPYVETVVSVAKIKVLEDLKILNLCTNMGLGDTNWKAEFILYLSTYFSRPVFEKRDYLLSQYISEYVKNQGYDGIAFRSAFIKSTECCLTKKGKNITVFNWEKCKAINSNLYLADKIEVKYSAFKGNHK